MARRWQPWSNVPAAPWRKAIYHQLHIQLLIAMATGNYWPYAPDWYWREPGFMPGMDPLIDPMMQMPPVPLHPGLMNPDREEDLAWATMPGDPIYEMMFSHRRHDH